MWGHPGAAGLSYSRAVIGFAKFAEANMSVPAPTERVLRFGTFELDIRVGELRKRGEKLRLQGQPLQVLAILLMRAGDLVTREDGPEFGFRAPLAGACVPTEKPVSRGNRGISDRSASFR
jgi:hypothetical protein